MPLPVRAPAGTGASIHQATGYPVAVADCASNLKPVGLAVRAMYPAARLIMATDNDKSGTGRKYADEAAAAVGATVALPQAEGQDWNDVHKAEGLEAVKAQIAVGSGPVMEADQQNGCIGGRLELMQDQREAICEAASRLTADQYEARRHALAKQAAVRVACLDGQRESRRCKRWHPPHLFQDTPRHRQADLGPACPAPDVAQGPARPHGAHHRWHPRPRPDSGPQLHSVATRTTCARTGATGVAASNRVSHPRRSAPAIDRGAGRPRCSAERMLNRPCLV